MSFNGDDRMVVEFMTTYAINIYQHEPFELESHSAIPYYVIKFVSGYSSFPGDKTHRHDIEILLKMALNTINQTKPIVVIEATGSL